LHCPAKVTHVCGRDRRRVALALKHHTIGDNRIDPEHAHAINTTVATSAANVNVLKSDFSQNPLA